MSWSSQAPLVARDHPVLDLMRTRGRSATRQDCYKLGLAVQGGGMRGVVSAAMLTALYDHGHGDTFDVLYGSSSGALNAAYFLDGGGTWQRLGVYWDHLTCRRFVDPIRWLRGGDILDLDYVFDVVLRQEEPLDVTALLRHRPRLHIAITLVDQLCSHTVSDFDDAAELFGALKASAWLPHLVRGTGNFRGQRALDGALLTVAPHRFAVADGCTHVLSLSARPGGQLKASYEAAGALWRPGLDRIAPGLGKAHQVAADRYRRDRVELAQGNLAPPTYPPYVLDVAPLPWMRQVTPFERSPGRLIVAARQAYQLMSSVLAGRTVDDLTRTRLRFVAQPQSPQQDLIDPDSSESATGFSEYHDS